MHIRIQLAASIVLVALAAPTALADGLVDVQTTGDADGELLAFSATGDSRGGIAVTPLGDADGYIVFSLVGNCTAYGWSGRCIDVSDGDAEGYWLALSATGDANGQIVGVAPSGNASGLLPLSATGECSDPGHGGPCFVASPGDANAYYVALSMLGNASACRSLPCAALSLTGDANGQQAVAPLGSADGRSLAIGGSGARGGTAVSAFGGAEGLAAVSAFDGARSTCGFSNCVAASGAGDAEAPTALSIFGDARTDEECVNDGWSYCDDGVAVSIFGDAQALSHREGSFSTGSVAVSAFGDAEGDHAVSGCDWLACQQG